MTTVPVHVVDMGAAAAVGAARFARNGYSALIVHAELTLEEQAVLIAALLLDGEQPVCAGLLADYPDSPGQPQHMINMLPVRQRSQLRPHRM